MRTILIILAAVFGLAASGATNEPTIQMLATTNGVVKLPSNITSVRIGGTVFTNLLGFGLAVSNNQLSVDTTQLPAGGGGGGSGTVTSVGGSTTVSGLGFSGSPVTESGTLSLTGTVAVASGGTGATDASGARTALSLVPGTDVQAYDADLAAVAALANSGIIVRTGSGTVAARTITGDTEAVVNNGDGVSGNPTLSIGAAIARDAEVAAAYQPLDPDLTQLATLNGGSLTNLNGTEIRSGTVAAARIDAAIARLDSPALDGTPTAPTASLGTSNSVLATTAYVQQLADLRQLASAILSQLAALTNGSAGQVPTWTGANTLALSNLPAGGGTWDGTPVPSGTVTNLAVETINGDEVWSVYNGDIWSDGEGYGAYSDVFYPHWYGFAIASGLPLAQTATTNNPSVTPLGASANSNSGYSYAAGTTSEDIGGGGKLFLAKGAFTETNLVVGRCGFQDSVTATEPTDGAYIRWANGYLYGVIRNAGAETVTSTSNLLAASSTTYYELLTRVDNASSVTFALRQATAPMVFTTVWADSLTNTLPTGASRLTGHGIAVYRTSGSAGLNLFNLDALGKKNLRRPVR